MKTQNIHHELFECKVQIIMAENNCSQRKLANNYEKLMH